MARLTRAALLPTVCDPFLLEYWLKFFNQTWGKEVDKLYIYVNGKLPVDVNYRLIELVDNPKIYGEGIDHGIDHGPAIDHLLDMCNEDLVMLVEEDAFIFKPGVIDKCFKEIESGAFDIVGSPRASCTFEIVNKAKEVWGTDDHGPNFWPNFFFCKKADLLKTDRKFGSKEFKKGEYVPQLDLTMQETGYGDTFVWTSLQLRALGLKIKEIEQYHGSPEDIKHSDEHFNIFDGKCPWFHVGSLSGWRKLLIEDEIPSMSGSLEEWERRVQFWLTFWENSDPTKIPEFRKKYKDGIDNLIKAYGLRLEEIKKRQKIYEELINGN